MAQVLTGGPCPPGGTPCWVCRKPLAPLSRAGIRICPAVLNLWKWGIQLSPNSTHLLRKSPVSLNLSFSKRTSCSMLKFAQLVFVYSYFLFFPFRLYVWLCDVKSVWKRCYLIFNNDGPLKPWAQNLTWIQTQASMHFYMQTCTSLHFLVPWNSSFFSWLSSSFQSMHSVFTAAWYIYLYMFTFKPTATSLCLLNKRGS